MITIPDCVCWHLTDLSTLDPIYVFWVDVEPGKGYCTITCYGRAWTVYFNGMGGCNIREFFAKADTPYMVGKMCLAKSSKRDDIYLGRIIDAIKSHLIPLVCGKCGAKSDGGICQNHGCE